MQLEVRKLSELMRDHFRVGSASGFSSSNRKTNQINDEKFYVDEE
jgi:hypothetical protein